MTERGLNTSINRGNVRTICLWNSILERNMIKKKNTRTSCKKMKSVISDSLEWSRIPLPSEPLFQ